MLGTAGTLIENLSFFRDKIGILIHVDNATNFDLNELIEAHKKRTEGCILTMLTFNSNNTKACGIVEKNSKGKNSQGYAVFKLVYIFWLISQI